MGTVYHAFVTTSTGGALNTNEALSWTGGTGILDIDGIPVDTIRFIHSTGDVPEAGDVLTGAVTGATRTIGTVSSAVFTSNVAHPGVWYQISPKPVEVSEAVTWGGGAGGGTISSGSGGTVCNVFHDTGRPPEIDDIVLGAVTNITITGFGFTASGDILQPINTALAGLTVTEATWTTELTKLADDLGPGGVRLLRFMLVYMTPTGGGTFFQALQNAVYADAADTTSIGESRGESTTGRLGYYSAQDLSSIQPNGLQQIIAPAVSPPRWARWFFDIDSLGSIGTNIENRGSYPSGATIRWHVKMVGSVTNPPGELRQDLTGAFVPMVGTFAKWQVSAQVTGYPGIVGSMTYVVANYYLTWSSLASSPLLLHQEQFTQFPEVEDLTYDSVDVRYSDLRVYASDGRWHVLNDWQIANTSHPTCDPKHGWTPLVPGKLTLVCGNTSLDYNNMGSSYVLGGLTYGTSRNTPLVYTGKMDTLKQAGLTGLYRGPTWTGPDALPYVQQDHRRGIYTVHPKLGDDVWLQFVCPESGTYRIVGSFARASTSTGSGDGVRVSVTTAGVVRHNAAIVSNHGVDATSAATIFGGTGVSNFDIAVFLPATAVVRFTVSAVGESSFDATAFRITELSYALFDSSFTGWGGHRGTPGRDRAVRCPRCGFVLKEADLIVDGVTHTLVCTECYDPPPQPPNFRWPFRG